MSSDRKRRSGCISNDKILEVAEKLCPSHKFTNAAAEGLRLAHEAFLEELAERLASSEKALVSKNDVVKVLGGMGLHELAKEAEARCADQPGKAKKSKKSMKWNTELAEEQEKLLEETKREVEKEKAAHLR